MKVLLVNTFDTGGGAARATYRLHKALLAQNIDSQMMVQTKHSDDCTVIGPKSKLQMFFNLSRPAIDQLPTILYKNRSKMLFSPAWFGLNGISERINSLNPDIVHLHWICGGMMRIEDIAKIEAPIVWSLHDMWAFTDGYHHDRDYDVYATDNILSYSPKAIKLGLLSRSVFKRKSRAFARKKDITIVGLSRWLNDCSKHSILLGNKMHVNLPNPIDIDVYKKSDKTESRELWNLPKDKKLILFGAISATSDINKGFKELSEALSKLEHNDFELVVFGSSNAKESHNFKFPAHYLGYLHDDVSLVTLYSAVDVMVVPSLQENLSNAIMESLACATPVVAFNIGGNSDMIEHKANGYLAKPYDTEDLALGVEWILSAQNYNDLCQSARDKVLRDFDSKVVSKKYISLYEEVLSLQT